MKVFVFLAGVAVGVVVGATAGRPAYDRLTGRMASFVHSDSVQQVKKDVQDFAVKTASELGDRAGEVVDKVSGTIDDITGKSASES